MEIMEELGAMVGFGALNPYHNENIPTWQKCWISFFEYIGYNFFVGILLIHVS